MEKTLENIEKFQDVKSFTYCMDVFGNEKIDEKVCAKIKEKEPTIKTPSLDILATLTFNENTKWTDEELPKKILEYGKIPPLGIEELHKNGLTGEGVNVAIIDQPLALNHPEYKNQIVSYKVFSPDGYQMSISSYHGPAVASMLAGKNLGTAPKVNVYYYAFPSWLADSLYAAQALEDIVKVNKTLDDKHKIKFVSVSASLSGNGSPFKKNFEAWDNAFELAKKDGICVVDCSQEHGFIGIGFVDFTDKSFKYGFPDNPYKKPFKKVHVPNSLRTVAECYDNEHFSYRYDGKGGLSWGIPYATGVLCLGQQLNPNLSAEELKKILIETAQKNNNVISPKEYIEKVKSTLNKSLEI